MLEWFYLHVIVCEWDELSTHDVNLGPGLLVPCTHFISYPSAEWV